MGSGMVSVESSERLEARRTPLATWLQIANIVTLAFVSLALFKLYKALVIVYRWLATPAPSLQHIRTILFIGAKTDLNIHLLQELSMKFNTPVIPLQKNGVTPSPKNSRILLYGGECGGSQEEVLSLFQLVISAHGPVDLLVVSDQTGQQSDFLSNLNQQLLAQFWIVTAFLPNMLHRNSGSIMSIALENTTSMANAGVMRTVYEDMVQRDSLVSMTLVERNTWLERLVPLPPFLMAQLAVNCIGSTQVLLLPTLLDYIHTIPLLLGRMYLKPFLDFLWSSRSSARMRNQERTSFSK